MCNSHFQIQVPCRAAGGPAVPGAMWSFGLWPLGGSRPTMRMCLQKVLTLWLNSWTGNLLKRNSVVKTQWGKINCLRPGIFSRYASCLQLDHHPGWDVLVFWGGPKSFNRNRAGLRSLSLLLFAAFLDLSQSTDILFTKVMHHSLFWGTK